MIFGRWIQYLKNKPDCKAHKFELMELVDMSPRAFESFRAWFMWKMGENMKFIDDEFTYRPDIEEEIVQDEEVIQNDEIVKDEEIIQEEKD